MLKQYSFSISNYEFSQQLQDHYVKAITFQFVGETGLESERHEKILKGNYAITGQVIGNVFFPDDTVSSVDIKVKKFTISKLRSNLSPIFSLILTLIL